MNLLIVVFLDFYFMWLLVSFENLSISSINFKERGIIF